MSYADCNGDGQVTPTEIIEENNYYPFGLKHQGYNDIANSCGNEQAQQYKFLDREYESSFGLNVTETDFRQYDSALGRFYSIDALAEHSFDVTPYHYGLNNPVYWADPTGLISDPFWNSIWSFSPSGVTNWNNVGGSFLSDRVNSNGTVWEVFYDGSVKETLSMMYMEAKAGAGGGVNWSSLGSFNIGRRVQDHVYRNSSLYQYHRDQMKERQMDEFQEGMDYLGTFDPTGGIDFFNGVGYGLRGQYGNMAISGIAIFPYLGDLAKLGKYGNKSLKGIRALGIAGEEAVGVSSKVRIESLTGTAKYRIPDILTKSSIEEIKNVKHLSLTRQLNDFYLYSQKHDLRFILHTRSNTTFSRPLQNLINNGNIINKTIPFK